MKNLLIAILALFLGEADASNVLHQETYEAGFAVGTSHELVLRGNNAGTLPATLIVRLDDAGSSDYASRINEEWVVMPGPFLLHLPVASFKTPKKRKLDLSALKSMRVFTFDDGVALTGAAWALPEPISTDVLALDFGPVDGAVAPGFLAVTEADPRISGKLEAVERPYLDPLVSDGVRGIERISIPAQPGLYQLTLWTEDIGQWETPPRYIERRIKINGEVVLHERFTDHDWRINRYLQNAHTNELPQRGRPQTFPVMVGPGHRQIEIAFAGDNKTALFVSALVLEKGPVPQMRDQVNTLRAGRYAALWPVMEAVKTAQPASKLEVARSRIAALELGYTPEFDTKIDNIGLVLPTGLKGEVRLAQSRLARPNPQKRLLVRDERTLRGDVVGEPLKSGETRKVYILVFADHNAKLGDQTGQLVINNDRIEFPVSVFDRPRNDRGRYRGVYLDHAYYLTNPSDLRSQLWCDVSYLAKLGFTTIAPPFSLDVAAFKEDYAFYAAAGFDGQIFVYAALKRWIRKYGIEEAANRARQVNQPNLIWSIADEPSNPGVDSAALTANIKKIRETVPDIRLAGHLNSPRDAKFVGLFDVVLVNAGFADHLDDVPEETELWFYNIQQSDGTLPVFVTQNEDAQGILQWHARNPLGDPYDPTDGREGDASFLLPSEYVCPVVPDIDSQLIKLVE
jgi:hypothetical protein